MDALSLALEAALDVVLKATIPDVLVGDYDVIRDRYWNAVNGAVYDYLSGDTSITAPRNIVRKAIADYFPQAFYTGYVDGAGEGAETESDDESWLAGRMSEELGYVISLFENLRDARSGDLSRADIEAEAERRADGYTATLDAIYNEGKLRGAKNVMLTFTGDDGKESCSTCQRMKGQRHSAKWWVGHEMMPGIPGNCNYECCGYECDHYLEDDDGNAWTE